MRMMIAAALVLGLAATTAAAQEAGRAPSEDATRLGRSGRDESHGVDEVGTQQGVRAA